MILWLLSRSYYSYFFPLLIQLSGQLRDNLRLLLILVVRNSGSGTVSLRSPVWCVSSASPHRWCVSSDEASIGEPRVLFGISSRMAAKGSWSWSCGVRVSGSRSDLGNASRRLWRGGQDRGTGGYPHLPYRPTPAARSGTRLQERHDQQGHADRVQGIGQERAQGRRGDVHGGSLGSKKGRTGKVEKGLDGASDQSAALVLSMVWAIETSAISTLASPRVRPNRKRRRSRLRLSRWSGVIKRRRSCS